MQDINERQREYVRKQAMVYGKDPRKKLTPWHTKVNDAAYELALSDPNILLQPRQDLIKAAQNKVREQGYIFVKGKSRSKHTPKPDESSSPPPKRPKINETIRNKKITELQEDVKDLKDRLSYKEKQRDQATQAMNYKLCDQLTEEMTSVKKQLRQVEHELCEWTQKQNKSQWYFQRKKKRSSGTSTPGDSESEDSVLPSSSPGSDVLSSRSSSHDHSPPPGTVPTTLTQSGATSTPTVLLPKTSTPSSTMSPPSAPLATPTLDVNSPTHELLLCSPDHSASDVIVVEDSADQASGQNSFH